jgi:uncharacterized protein (TIGR02145 family)
MEKPERIKIPIAALLPITAALLLDNVSVLPWTTISWIPGGNTVYVKGFGAMEDCDLDRRPAVMRWRTPKSGTLYEDWWTPPKDEAASVTRLIIKRGVTRIGNNTFIYTNLISAKIPASVTSIGDRAFLGCKDLISVVSLNPVPPTVGRDAFKGVSSNACLYVPISGIDAYRSADEWKNFVCVKELASAPKAPERRFMDGKPSESTERKKEARRRIKENTVYFTDSRDGRTYRAVKIGGLIWMAENLNYETPDNSWCYKNKKSNCGKYGRLYSWDAAMKACPDGYHLPSSVEWDSLTQAAGGKKCIISLSNMTVGSVGAGRTLKAKNGWKRNGLWNENSGTDDYGFSALPGGLRGKDGSFDGIGMGGIWWEAAENGVYNGHYHSMNHLSDDVSQYAYGESKNYGFSVRCVADRQ